MLDRKTLDQQLAAMTEEQRAELCAAARRESQRRNVSLQKRREYQRRYLERKGLKLAKNGR